MMCSPFLSSFYAASEERVHRSGVDGRPRTGLDQVPTLNMELSTLGAGRF